MENFQNQQTGIGGPNFTPSTPPDNNLVWAILSTLLCCLPLGIVSIVKATEVNSKWAQGDHQGAIKSAADAKKYAMWGAIAGIITIIISTVFGLGTTFLAALGASAN